MIDVTLSIGLKGTTGPARTLFSVGNEALNANDRKGSLVTETSVEAAVESWVAELSDQGSVSASAVQDHLLDLWGTLDEGAMRSEIERWLTETLERELYLADDVAGRLGDLIARESVA